MVMLWKCQCGHLNRTDYQNCPKCDGPQCDMVTIMLVKPAVEWKFWKGVGYGFAVTGAAALAGWALYQQWVDGTTLFFVIVTIIIAGSILNERD